MLEETAVVVDVEGDFAWVQTQRQSACGSCAANKGCGTAVVGKAIGNKLTRVRAINRANAKRGDQVIVGIQPQALVRGSLIVYLLPLLGLLVGALFGGVVFLLLEREYVEGWRVICSLAGLAAGFWGLARFSRRIAENSAYQMIVLRRSESPVHFVPSQKIEF
ncbi:MAG: SoxR reducing system RseC family protein [Gammaproteobacteria bacterium]|nr:SoxR reducing system RseC family protein [Gammaproteobacteria bacterium]